MTTERDVDAVHILDRFPWIEDEVGHNGRLVLMPDLDPLIERMIDEIAPGLVNSATNFRAHSVTVWRKVHEQAGEPDMIIRGKRHIANRMDPGSAIEFLDFVAGRLEGVVRRHEEGEVRLRALPDSDLDIYVTMQSVADIDASNVIGLYMAQSCSEVPPGYDDQRALGKIMADARLVMGEFGITEVDQIVSIADPVAREFVKDVVRSATEARQALIVTNTRLVISIAKRYQGRGLPLPDLIQEGNIGLMRAADKYDYTKGVMFSTYATWWIRESVSRACKVKGRTIRISEHKYEEIGVILRATRQLEQELGRAPYAEEIEAYIPVEGVNMAEVWAILREPASLEAMLDESDEGSATVGEMIPDATQNTEVQTAELILKEDLIRLIGLVESQDERKGEILRLYYGIDGIEPLTLEQIGKHLGISRERVRQLQHTALRELRGHARRINPNLAAYLGIFE